MLLFWTAVRLAGLTVVVLACVLAAGQAPWLAERLVDAAVAAGQDLTVPSAGLLPLPTVAAGLAAGVAAGGPWTPAGRPVRHAVTLLHELGHVTVGAACGARPHGIVLNHDTSGHATSRWRSRTGPLARLQRAATAWAGYPAPTVFAAAGVGLLPLAGPRAVLWALTGAAVLVLLLGRSMWTLAVSVGLGAVTATTLLWEPAVDYAAVVAVALPVAVATSAVHGHVRGWRRPLPDGHDAHAVHAQVRLPARLVHLTQVVTTLAAAAAGLWLLTGTVALP